MERGIANRLHWFLESKQKLNKEEAGFKRDRSNTDHTVQLKTDVKLSFSKKRSTLAVFLNISKTSVCSQGFVFKAIRMEATPRKLE
jgi:hypothetical protein